MHIYIFGSICRGEIDKQSDVDLLAITNDFDNRFDRYVFSVYSYDRIQYLWNEGGPFAWHLWKESKLIYSSDNTDYIEQLAKPKEYRNSKNDCKKFFYLYTTAAKTIKNSPNKVFELSNIFLAIRNYAICFLLGKGVLNFSRHVAIQMSDLSLQISLDSFQTLEKARVLTTRGYGSMIAHEDVTKCIHELSLVSEWFAKLNKESFDG